MPILIFHKHKYQHGINIYIYWHILIWTLTIYLKYFLFLHLLHREKSHKTKYKT